MRSRKIGSLESLVFYHDQVQSQNFCVFIETSIIINVDRFHNILQYLFLKHDILKAYREIDKFKILTTISCDFRCVETSDDAFKIINQELNFIFSKPPLWRARLFRKKQSTLIVLTFHHAIADARSAISFLNDLLRRYENSTHIIDLHPCVSSLENLMCLPCSEKTVLFDQLNFENRKVVNQKLDALYLQKEMVIELKFFCKDKNITIHSLLAAVLLQTIFLLKKVTKINLKSPIDMRRYLKSIRKTNFGYFLSKFDLLIDNEKSQEITKIAKKLHEEINCHLYENSLHFLLSLPLIVDAINKIDIDFFDLSRKEGIPVAFISNAGEFNFPQSISLERFGFALNSNSLISEKKSILMTVLTINNNMSIMFHFPCESDLDPKQTKKMFFSLISKLIV